MGTKFQVDDSGNITKAKSIKLDAIAPPTPAAGLLYFDTSSSTLKVCGDGSSFSNATNLSSTYVQPALNRISQLITADLTFSKGGFDAFAEAYIDADGRKNSVTVANTTSLFITNKYARKENWTASGTTETYSHGTYDGAVWTNPITTRITVGAQDGYISSFTIYSSGGNNTFTITEVSSGSVIYTKTAGGSWALAISDYRAYMRAGQQYDIYVFQASGSLGAKLTSYAGTLFSFTNQYALSGYDSGSGAYVFQTMSGATDTSVIEHAVPAGTFSSTISKFIGIPYIADWDTGANIQVKLTNATEDSGYFNYNTEASFTAFTSQPTKAIVKMLPKSSSPTVGYPSVNGFYIKEL